MTIPFNSLNEFKLWINEFSDSRDQEKLAVEIISRLKILLTESKLDPEEAEKLKSNPRYHPIWRQTPWATELSSDNFFPKADIYCVN